MPSGRLDAFNPPPASPQRAAVLDVLADAVVALPPGSAYLAEVDPASRASGCSTTPTTRR